MKQWTYYISFMDKEKKNPPPSVILIFVLFACRSSSILDHLHSRKEEGKGRENPPNYTLMSSRLLLMRSRTCSHFVV